MSAPISAIHLLSGTGTRTDASATAIEPHPTNLRLLRANLALNGLSERVRVLAQAVGESPACVAVIPHGIPDQ